MFDELARRYPEEAIKVEMAKGRRVIRLPHGRNGTW